MKKSFVITVLIVLISIYFTNIAYTNINKEELFGKIIDYTSSKVKCCGVKVIFKTQLDGEKKCNIIAQKLDITKGCNMQAYKDGIVYCIDFKGKYITGYVESVNYEKYSIVTINVEKNINKNEICSMEKSILNSIDKEENDIKIYSFVQANLPDNNISQANHSISEFLKKNGAININTTKIDNGYSTTVYIGGFNYIDRNNRLEDLNFAVNKYSTGAMLTIGTPIITSSY